jgi:phage terminase small subunit
LKKKLTPKERALVKNVSKGKSLTAAAIAAGYSDKNPAQSGFNAMQAIQRKMPDLMDKLGLSDETLINKHLKPLLAAKETKFFAFRKVVTVKSKKEGEKDSERVEQIIQEREVAALGIRAGAVDMAFKLRGSYAPKQIDFDPDAGTTVTVINTSAIPRHG